MLSAYRAAVAALRFASPAFSRGESKLARGVRARRRASDRLVDWCEGGRDHARPLIWLHAPSVGESLQAEAVARALRGTRSDLQAVMTYFSPSVDAWSKGLDVDLAAVLPWDLPGTIGPVLDAVRPDVVAFTKTEIWPVLIDEAGRRGIPAGVVAASVPEGAGRTRWPTRPLLRASWRRLAFAGATGERDARHLVDLGVREEVVTVTGDPGIDAAVARVRGAAGGAFRLGPLRGARRWIVAGSTWESDERVLVPALRRIRASVTDVGVVLAPHEPDPSRVRGLVSELAVDGWRVRTLTGIEDDGDLGEANAVVVDRMGVLAALYTIAAAAYVGGGFHRAGLHSVVEPAAAGVPVVFGPSYRRSSAATDLLGEGGAKLARDPTALSGVLVEWLSDEALREEVGVAAVGYIERHRGAAERTAALLHPFFEQNR